MWGAQEPPAPLPATANGHAQPKAGKSGGRAEVKARARAAIRAELEKAEPGVAVQPWLCTCRAARLWQPGVSVMNTQGTSARAAHCAGWTGGKLSLLLAGTHAPIG